MLLQHHEDMQSESPPESVHALDLSALQASNVTFWSVWESDQLAGCGALKEIDARHGEIKSMRTSDAFRRQGVAEKVLKLILAEASNRSYQRLSLETGSMDFFEPAKRIYRKFGFEECGPFGGYQLDPYSLFMTLDLKST